MLRRSAFLWIGALTLTAPAACASSAPPVTPAYVPTLPSPAADDPQLPPPAAVDWRDMTIEGALDKQQVEMGARRGWDPVRRCDDDALAHDQPPRGSIRLRFVIGPDGHVSSSRIASWSLTSRVLARCLVQVPRAWTFPRPADGKPVTVEYPIRFHPGVFRNDQVLELIYGLAALKAAASTTRISAGGAASPAQLVIDAQTVVRYRVGGAAGAEEYDLEIVSERAPLEPRTAAMLAALVLDLMGADPREARVTRTAAGVVQAHFRQLSPVSGVTGNDGRVSEEQVSPAALNVRVGRAYGALHELLGRMPPGPGAPTTPGAQAPPLSPSLRTLFERESHFVGRCFEAQLPAAPPLTEAVLMQFSVGPAGDVISARAVRPQVGKPTEQCLAAAARRLVFPATAGPLVVMAALRLDPGSLVIYRGDQPRGPGAALLGPAHHAELAEAWLRARAALRPGAVRSGPAVQSFATSMISGSYSVVRKGERFQHELTLSRSAGELTVTAATLLVERLLFLFDLDPARVILSRVAPGAIRATLDLGADEQRQLDARLPPHADELSPGVLDAERVYEVITSHAVQLRRCYSQTLKQARQLGGTLDLHWVIGHEGKVIRAWVARRQLGTTPVGTAQAFESCLVQTVEQWKFDRPAFGHSVRVRHPLTFVPRQ
jgi:hypothetical protein